MVAVSNSGSHLCLIFNSSEHVSVNGGALLGKLFFSFFLFLRDVCSSIRNRINFRASRRAVVRRRLDTQSVRSVYAAFSITNADWHAKEAASHADTSVRVVAFDAARSNFLRDIVMGYETTAASTEGGLFFDDGIRARTALCKLTSVFSRPRIRQTHFKSEASADCVQRTSNTSHDA